MGTAIARHRVQLQKQQHTLQAQPKCPSSSTTETAPKSRHYKPNNKPWKPTIDYQQSLHALSQAIHPFDLNNRSWD